MIVGLGARSDHIATVPNADPVRLNMSGEEAQLFASVGRVSTIGEVLDRCGLPEPRAIAVLLSLRAKGAIAPARVQKAEARMADVDATLLEANDLSIERKKEILDLERSLDKVDLFALLKVPPGAEPAQVKAAYYELSRQFHPDRFFGRNLGSYRARVERIFRKLTEAQDVLTTPDRRREYLDRHPHLAAAASPSRSFTPSSSPAPLFDEEPALSGPEARARAEERRSRFSRHPYLAKAKKVNDLVAAARRLIADGSFEQAMNELVLAAQLDPKNREVPALHLEARRKHDVRRAERELELAKEAEGQLDDAEAMRHYKMAAALDDENAELAYRIARLLHRSSGDGKEARALAQRAVELDPRKADYHALLGQLVLEAGVKKLAKRHFEDALKVDPEHPEAKAQVKKLRWTF